MKLRLADYAPDRTLAGALAGQEVFSALLKATMLPSAPTIIYLDFADIDVATGSFLRESVFAYQRHIRQHVPLLYPVMANLSLNVVEEMTLLLQLRGEAVLSCVVGIDEQPTQPRILGTIDGKQYEALQAVLALKETDAPTLAKTTPAQKPTVWNNRLSALVSKGLLMEIGNSKTKRYRSVLEGLAHGS